MGFSVQFQGVALVVGTGASQNQGWHTADIDQVSERIHIPSVGDLESIGSDLHRHARPQSKNLDYIGAGHLSTISQRLDDTRQPGPTALIAQPGRLVYARGFP